MEKEIAPKSKKTHKVPNRINPGQNTPRHTVIKLMKIKHTHKKTNINSSKGKTTDTMQGIPIRITANLSI